MDRIQQCTKCKQFLPVDAFYFNKQRKKLGPWCKKCLGIYHKKYYREHRIQCYAHTKKAIARYLSEGNCRICGKPRLPNSNWGCERHYIQESIANAIGYRSAAYATQMQIKLHNQNYTCPYTGKKLILGLNAQIDHIQPRSRFPELQSNIDNLRWISAVANRAKGSLTHKEFILFCKNIASKFP